MSNKRIPKEAKNKQGEYALVGGPFPYHAREDQTTLPPNCLVSPSRNVVNNTANRLQLVKGYTLDGGASATVDSGIRSNYDFHPVHTDDVRNVRAGFLTNAGNDGKLQYRYVDANNVVSWVDLKTSLTTVDICFDGNYWDTTQLIKLLLWVDGSNYIYSWNGAVTTFASATSNTLTKEGTTTWAQEGFTATGSVTVGGVPATYTGGFGTTTLTGVSVDFSATTVATEIHQTPVTTALSTFASSVNINFTGNNAALTAYVNPTGTSPFIPNNNNLVGASLIATNSFSTNPSNAQTFILNLNGTAITFTFVTAIGVTAGNVLIETTLAGTMNNLLDLLQNPSSTNAKHVALSGGNQTLVGYLTSSLGGGLATFAPTVIGCGRQNQVYLGSSQSNNLFISKVNNYLDYTFTSPVRVAGEGALISMDAPPVKFIAQEVHGDQQAYDMWISTGLSNWSIIRSTLSSDNSKEALEFIRLKTAPLQGAISERLCSKMKNHIIFVGNDQVVNALGYISYQYVPVMQDLSYPIIDDMASYDMTDGAIFFHKNYLYISVPTAGLIRIYNMTNQTEEQYSNYNPQESLDAKQPFFWEAPVDYPISGFYITSNGELGGHGYNTSESFILFSGGSFNTQDIDANATFTYNAHGDRTQSKGSNEIYVEGYILQNTVLTGTINEDLDAAKTTQTVTIDGANSAIVAFGSGAHSLGKDNLGSRTLGGTLTTITNLPAWFHAIPTYTQNSYYLEQLAFTTKGVDLDWQLICFGTNAAMTNEGNNAITY